MTVPSVSDVPRPDGFGDLKRAGSLSEIKENITSEENNLTNPECGPMYRGMALFFNKFQVTCSI